MVMNPDDPLNGAIREGDPPFRSEKPPENALSNPIRFSAYFWLLLILNVAAAYSSAPFWIYDLPGSGSSAMILLYSPIAISLLFLMGSSSLVLPTVFLVSFLLLIATLSFLLRRSRIAIAVTPILVFLICLAQGLVFAWIIRGIDAIGHS